jgi:hypothetical protein
MKVDLIKIVKAVIKWWPIVSEAKNIFKNGKRREKRKESGQGGS